MPHILRAAQDSSVCPPSGRYAAAPDVFPTRSWIAEPSDRAFVGTQGRSDWASSNVGGRARTGLGTDPPGPYLLPDFHLRAAALDAQRASLPSGTRFTGSAGTGAPSSIPPAVGESRPDSFRPPVVIPSSGQEQGPSHASSDDTVHSRRPSSPVHSSIGPGGVRDAASSSIPPAVRGNRPESSQRPVVVPSPGQPRDHSHGSPVDPTKQCTVS